MTVLLSLTVFMNIVSELMPITSDAVPLIGEWRPSLLSSGGTVCRNILQFYTGDGCQQVGNTGYVFYCFYCFLPLCGRADQCVAAWC